MPLDSFNDVLADALRRADEPVDSTSDWDTAARDQMIRLWRSLTTRWPWLGLRANPPGVFVTTAPITTLTITVSSTGTDVAGTLSAAPAGSVSIQGRKIRPGGGRNWITRVTAHAAGGTAVTLDAVPATLAAGTATTIFQDEYDLASTLGAFVDGIWNQDGALIRLRSEEVLKAHYPDPPEQAWPARMFARTDKSRIRFSSYPDAIYRCEYPYSLEPADPSGTGALAIDPHLRPIYADFVLAAVMELKSDRRWTQVQARAERDLRLAMAYETRLLTGLGLSNRAVPPAPYA